MWASTWAPPTPWCPVRGRGIVVNEPSVVAINRIDNSVLAIGKQAKTMVGRTPAHIVATRPLRDGVISDFDVTSRMLNHFIHEALQRSGIGIGRPRVMVGIPGGATEVRSAPFRSHTLGRRSRRASD